MMPIWSGQAGQKDKQNEASKPKTRSRERDVVNEDEANARRSIMLNECKKENREKGTFLLPCTESGSIAGLMNCERVYVEMDTL